jgi:hypothetical protein
VNHNSTITLYPPRELDWLIEEQIIGQDKRKLPLHMPIPKKTDTAMPPGRKVVVGRGKKNPIYEAVAC